MPVCSACGGDHPKVQYSKAQLRKKGARRCQVCVVAVQVPADSTIGGNTLSDDPGCDETTSAAATADGPSCPSCSSEMAWSSPLTIGYEEYECDGCGQPVDTFSDGWSALLTNGLPDGARFWCSSCKTDICPECLPRVVSERPAAAKKAAAKKKPTEDG